MPYYESQQGWGKNEFYCLHRYIHKMIWYHQSRMDEIKSLDLSRMTDETKVIMYCIIMYYGLNDLFELDNLQALRFTKPLPTPLVIDGDTVENDVYKEMNIYF